ncbi:biotin/lipoyl-containing protein [Sporomusa sphaeroides]|uniref:biotin/lipoyl-containing protein n=1 Tax=Sporomusa sphaeroides TaxID=47679 RepID=UPI002BF27F53|nr:biotin/lipoyl-containing protein [Sporomusa sphaeroides]HML31859.1 biotin/lipoyl-binding protein [Sporomusa sphaeroides]
MYDVQMPKFGMTMESGEISEWFVREGDKVTKGQALCEISSEKITNSLECYTNGTIEKILVEEGEEANIGDVIAIIKED